MTSRLPTLSVIIPTLGRGEMLLDTLGSLFRQDHDPLEVIVVDQTPAYTQEIESALAGLEASGRIRRIREGIPNLPRARNIGLLQARGEVVLFLDDDVLLPKGFLRRHLRHYQDRGIDAVTGMILHPGERARDRPRLPVSRKEGRRRLDIQIMRHRTSLRDPVHFVGANMSFRRSALLRIDGFHHGFVGTALGEEVEAAGRLHRAGFRSVYDPRCFLLHRVAQSGGCRQPDAGAFRRARERQRNLYFAIFHGLRLRMAIGAIRRRLLNRVQTPLGPSTRQPRARASRLATLCGRIAGGVEGMGLAWRKRREGGSMRRLAMPPEDGPALSIVIPTYNRGKPLVSTLRSLLSIREVDFEVIVVDQTENHEPDTEAFLHSLASDRRFRYLVQAHPNASAARNRGAVAARAPILLFLDDDVTPAPSLLTEHLAQYTDGTVSCVGGRIAWDAASLANVPEATFGVHEAATRPELPVCYTGTPFPDALHLITCNLSVRRDRFLEAGGFDEWFAGYGEDIEFVARLRRLGGRAVYHPGAAVIHHCSPTGGTRAAVRGPFAFGWRRGLAIHYSTLLSVGAGGWLAFLWRRNRSLLRRVLHRCGLPGMRESGSPLPAGGPVETILAGRGSRAARVAGVLSYKLPQLTGALLGAATAPALWMLRRAPSYMIAAPPHQRRILLVCGALEPGGIQSLLLGFLPRLGRMDNQIDICTMSKKQGTWDERFSKLGCRILHLPSGRRPLSFLLDLWDFLRACPCDVVHVHRSSHAMALPLLAAAAAGVRMRFAHYHNIRRRTGPFRNVLETILALVVRRAATRVIAVSEHSLGSQFGAAAPPKALILPNAIDTAQFSEPTDRREARSSLGIDRECFVLGHSGRFSEAKNQQFLIRLLPLLREHLPGVVLVLAGDGPRLPEMKGLARDLDVYHDVRFAGWVGDMPRLLHSLDVFLFPSLWEGFGLSLLEAQAAGIPCIASPLPCFREVLSPGNLKLSTSIDAPKAWIEGICRLHANPDLRRALGAEGARFARSFDLAGYTERLNSLYRDGGASL